MCKVETIDIIRCAKTYKLHHESDHNVTDSRSNFCSNASLINATTAELALEAASTHARNFSGVVQSPNVVEPIKLALPPSLIIGAAALILLSVTSTTLADPSSNSSSAVGSSLIMLLFEMTHVVAIGNDRIIIPASIRAKTEAFTVVARIDPSPFNTSTTTSIIVRGYCSVMMHALKAFAMKNSISCTLPVLLCVRQERLLITTDIFALDMCAWDSILGAMGPKTAASIDVCPQLNFADPSARVSIERDEESGRRVAYVRPSGR
mmetsp:Transcript_7361/g.10990  ORF Transcript_7361/g.10990 Transcript_7361/m.10990 type:complete len:264 (+) Transcript_7361:616-1407(+)